VARYSAAEAGRNIGSKAGEKRVREGGRELDGGPGIRRRVDRGRDVRGSGRVQDTATRHAHRRGGNGESDRGWGQGGATHSRHTQPLVGSIRDETRKANGEHLPGNKREVASSRREGRDVLHRGSELGEEGKVASEGCYHGAGAAGHKAVDNPRYSGQATTSARQPPSSSVMNRLQRIERQGADTADGGRGGGSTEAGRSSRKGGGRDGEDFDRWDGGAFETSSESEGNGDALQPVAVERQTGNARKVRMR
jgi:hypothetical protein